jgi:hypothetical protein
MLVNENCSETLVNKILINLCYVAPWLLSCLSPCDNMIPDEGIIACPNG